MTYTYCPYCGTTYGEQTKPYVYQCAHCGNTVYLHSAPTASALIIDGDRILLAKRAVDPFKGMWDIVGGFIEYGEHPEAALHREVMEETGLTVEIIDRLGFFIDTYGRNNESTLNIGFVVNIISGTPQAADDVAELRWFDKTHLPLETMAFQNGKDMLKAWLKSGAV